MKAISALILGMSILTTSTFAVPLQVDEVLPAANTVHAHRITISAGATLGRRHASVVRAQVVRDMLKKRHGMAVGAAGSAASDTEPVATPADSTGALPAGDKAVPAAASPASAAPSSAPSVSAVKAAVGRPGTTCTEANLLQCTITEWRDAEVCFVELCLN